MTNCLSTVIEARHVLLDHIELTRKSTPCLAVIVTHGSHVGPRLMHCRVHEEPGGIGGPDRVAAHHIAVIVDQHRVGRFHRGEVFPRCDQTCPRCILVSQILERLLPFDWQGTKPVHVRATRPGEHPDQHD
jgi:hypothetical protein